MVGRCNGWGIENEPLTKVQHGEVKDYGLQYVNPDRVDVSPPCVPDGTYKGRGRWYKSIGDDGFVGSFGKS